MGLDEEDAFNGSTADGCSTGSRLGLMRLTSAEAVLAHARLFFREFKPAADAAILSELAERPASHREYFAQLMLDFCAVDPDLDDAPIERCLEFARDLECLGAFEKLLTKELKVKAKVLKKLKEALA